VSVLRVHLVVAFKLKLNSVLLFATNSVWTKRTQKQMEKYCLFFSQNIASSITKYVHVSSVSLRNIFLFKCSTCVNQLLIKCSTHVHPLLTTFLIGLSISPKKRASFRRFPSLRKLHLLYHIEHRSSMPLSCQHIGGVGVVSLLCPPISSAR